MMDQRKKCKCTDIKRYRELHHAVGQRLKQERKQHWDNVTTELENAASRREFRTLYTTLRRPRGHDRAADECIKKKNGEYVKTNAERLFRWLEYFQELYNRPIPETPPPTPTDLQSSSQLISDEPLDIEKIRNAVGRLKRGKAAGCDNVTAEALKGGGNTLLRRLHSLIRLVWTSEQIPTSWKQAILVPIHKKGDKHQCKNYRGISLLSIVGKVFMRVVQQRVQSRHEEVSREEQAGFRPGRGCCDQIFTLQQVMEERIRCGKRLIVVFIDFAAAFDSVYHPALWNTLEAEGIPGKIIRLLQNTYDGSKCKVRVRGGMSESFTVSTGVR